MYIVVIVKKVCMISLDIVMHQVVYMYMVSMGCAG